MKYTDNYNLLLYEETDKFQITGDTDSLNANTALIDALCKTTANEVEYIKTKQAGAVDIEYKEKVAAATSKDEVDALFAEWWHYQYDAEKYTKVDMLNRWFGNVMVDRRVHGVKTPLYSTSTSMLGELTDDSAGLVCTPSTATVAGNDPFAHLPQFWCIEVSAEKKADGSHEIFYVEHIDDTADVRSGEHLCWVLQKNTYRCEWKDDEYKYLKIRSYPAAGYKRWPEGKDRTGKVHEYMAHPKYYAGIDADGVITCGTGLKPINRTSYTTGISKWRARGSQYSGASGSLPKFLDDMMRLKYGRKGNSGKIEGCVSYSYQYTAAVSETGVTRVILTTAQAANLLVGSAVMLGIQSGTDRGTASNYSICDGARISSIKSVTIDDTEYSAVYIDVAETFDTTAGSTFLSTSPYWSGYNDTVLGRDGSRSNFSNGKEPGLLQGVEFMNGSYLIMSDELLNCSRDADNNYLLDCYKCYDQSKCGTTINDNYVKADVPTMILPASWSWKYISDNAISDVALWPEAVVATGSGLGVGAAFYCVPDSGLRAPWVWGVLDCGGAAGLACRASHPGVGDAYWYSSLGAPGSEG